MTQLTQPRHGHACAFSHKEHYTPRCLPLPLFRMPVLLCKKLGNDPPVCPCGARFGQSSSPLQHMHTVHRVHVQLPGTTYQEELEVQLSAKLAGQLLLGSYYEMAVHVSEVHCNSPVATLDLRLAASSVNELHLVHLRAQQLQCPVQNAERLLQQRPLQSLVDVMRVAACPAGAYHHVTWYMLMAILTSAVAVGEDQRQGKSSGGERHRCQVCHLGSFCQVFNRRSSRLA